MAKNTAWHVRRAEETADRLMQRWEKYLIPNKQQAAMRKDMVQELAGSAKDAGADPATLGQLVDSIQQLITKLS